MRSKSILDKTKLVLGLALDRYYRNKLQSIYPDSNHFQSNSFHYAYSTAKVNLNKMKLQK